MLGRTRRLVVAVAIAVSALALGLVASPAQAAELRLVGEQALSDRLSELVVKSPAMGRRMRVRVLTPPGFDGIRGQLPVLWLLHGGFGQAPDWTTIGNAEALTAGLPLIVVMPDGGTGGWYSNWLNSTPEGPQRWETFHMKELRPFVESKYHTRTDRHGRAVAGLSMGGFGAMHYAARHSDLFGFAASFSGAVDSRTVGISTVINVSPYAHDGRFGDIFGQRGVNEGRWINNNPTDLAENLRGVELQIRTGNGQPGGRHGGGPDVIEMGCWEASMNLHNRLKALRIPHLFVDYGPGAHRWEYWQDDLRATLPAMMAHFSR
jgi:S-formylglutathione hydrolase FrmB